MMMMMMITILVGWLVGWLVRLQLDLRNKISRERAPSMHMRYSRGQIITASLRKR